MNQSNIAKVTHKSKSLVSGVIAGKIESPEKDTIFALLNFENKTLPEMLQDELFLEMCDVCVAKARNVKVREYAVLMKHVAIRVYKKNGK